MASRLKFDEVRALGAHELVERDEALEPESCDVVVDNVAGPGFPAALEAVRRGGCLVTSGAIAGPRITPMP